MKRYQIGLLGIGSLLLAAALPSHAGTLTPLQSAQRYVKEEMTKHPEKCLVIEIFPDDIDVAPCDNR